MVFWSWCYEGGVEKERRKELLTKAKWGNKSPISVITNSFKDIAYDGKAGIDQEKDSVYIALMPPALWLWFWSPNLELLTLMRSNGPASAPTYHAHSYLCIHIWGKASAQGIKAWIILSPKWKNAKSERRSPQIFGPKINVSYCYCIYWWNNVSRFWHQESWGRYDMKIVAKNYKISSFII